MAAEPTTADRFSRSDFSAEARAARNVPRNPQPLCRDFVEQPEPSAFWCGRCSWNRPMHDDETARAAIAAELDRLRTPAVEAQPDGQEPDCTCDSDDNTHDGGCATAARWSLAPAATSVQDAEATR